MSKIKKHKIVTNQDSNFEKDNNKSNWSNLLKNISNVQLWNKVPIIFTATLLVMLYFFSTNIISVIQIKSPRIPDLLIINSLSVAIVSVTVFIASFYAIMHSIKNNKPSQTVIAVVTTIVAIYLENTNIYNLSLDSYNVFKYLQYLAALILLQYASSYISNRISSQKYLNAFIAYIVLLGVIFANQSLYFSSKVITNAQFTTIELYTSYASLIVSTVLLIVMANVYIPLIGKISQSKEAN